MNTPKVALVTGASQGIGAATAVGFAKAGYRVALVARNREAMEQVAEQIRAGGGEALVGEHAALMSITPRLQAAALPDVKKTAAGLIAAAQVCSALNVEWAMRELGIRARLTR